MKSSQRRNARKLINGMLRAGFVPSNEFVQRVMRTGYWEGKPRKFKLKEGRVQEQREMENAARKKRILDLFQALINAMEGRMSPKKLPIKGGFVKDPKTKEWRKAKPGEIVRVPPKKWSTEVALKALMQYGLGEKYPYPARNPRSGRLPIRVTDEKIEAFFRERDKRPALHSVSRHSQPREFRKKNENNRKKRGK